MGYQPSVPDRIGRYHVIGKIAQGGMADVLLAKLVGPKGFERPVVIKRILPHLQRDSKFVEMFLDEAKIIAGIRHPNVVQVHELSEDEELFLVLEYLAGESVASLIKRMARKEKRIPYGVCAHVVAESAAGLHAAHELKGPDGEYRNVVHRDISPQNLFVTYDGSVKVIDFGIAKATDRMTKTEAGQIKGKFAYMSPESCRGGEIDRRTDLFALATVLYEMSTGVRLFERDTDMKTLEAVCYEAVTPPSQIYKDYPPALEKIVLKGLAKKPEDRYQTGSEMRRDLMRVAHELSVLGLPAEQLANAMSSLFADRLAEKTEMLKKVQAGETNVQTVGELEDDIELPNMGDAEEIGPVTGPSVTGMSMLDPISMVSSSKTWVRQQEPWKLAVMGAAVVIPVLLLFLVLKGEAPADPAAGVAAAPKPPATAAAPKADPPPAPEASPEAEATDGPAAEAAPAPEPEEAPEPAPPPAKTVVFDINTKPSGAGITINGQYRGITPAKLQVPASDEAVTVELVLEGYVKVTERMTPNMSQRMRHTFSRMGWINKEDLLKEKKETKREQRKPKIRPPTFKKRSDRIKLSNDNL